MTKTNGRIIIVIGIIILAIATWFAFRKPVPITLPTSVTDSTSTGSTPSSPSGTDPSGGATDPAGNGATGVGQAAKGKYIVVAFTAPASTSRLLIGDQYTITWNQPGGVTGQLYLVNSNTGAVVGWVEQSIGPAQVMFPWSARSVFVSHTSPAAENVIPGEYYLKLSFNSPDVSVATSQAFQIVATTTTE